LIGAIHDKATVSALRFHSALYAHGHQLGGTNPSLVEATGAGSGVLAHGNRYNRWVGGPGARYFEGEEECAATRCRAVRPVRDRAHARGEPRAAWGDVYVGTGVGGV